MMREFPDVLRGVSDDDNVTDVRTYEDGRLHIENLTYKELFELIYTELRKMNLHLAMLTGEEIKESDL